MLHLLYRIITLLAVAVMTPTAALCGDLAGLVTDTQGVPLPGVTLRLADRAVTTAADGTFIFTGVTEGVVDVAVVKAGFSPKSEQVSVPSQGQSQAVFPLTPSGSPAAYDVLVVGAGAGGVSAALQAARMGARVALLEETDWIGGQMTAAAVTSLDEGQPPLRYGIYREFRDRIVSWYALRSKSTGTAYYSAASTAFEPSVGQKILYEMLREVSGAGRVDLFLATGVQSLVRNGSTVKGVKTASGETLNAFQVIDATEYGDLLPLTPFPYRVGNTTSDRPNPDACIQNITYTAVIKQFPQGAPPTLVMGDPPRPYDPSLFEFLSPAGSTWLENGRVPYPLDFDFFKAWRGMPDSANPQNYEASRSSHGAISKTGLNYYNGVHNTGNDYGTTVRFLEDKAFRRQEVCAAKLKTLNMLHYIQNNMGQVQWTVADDEGFASSQSNNSLCDALPAPFKPIEQQFPVIPYVRESRRLLGLMTLTSADIRRNGQRSLKNFKSALALGSYPIDLHGCTRDADLDCGDSSALLSDDWVAKPPEVGIYQIPFETFVPEMLDGLLVAEKNLSVSRLVNGTIRLQPVVMATGQAVGALAALASRYNVQPRLLSPFDVQRQLLDDGASLSRYDFPSVPLAHPFWKYIQLATLYEFMPSGDARTFDIDAPVNRYDMNDVLQKAFGNTLSAMPLSASYVTRAELAAMLVPALGGPESATTQGYQDLASTHWGYAAVQALELRGIHLPCSTEPLEFCPDRPVTRGETAAFVGMTLYASGKIPATYAGLVRTSGSSISAGIAINAGAPATSSRSVSLQLSASDPVSAITDMRFSKDNFSWFGWETFKTTRLASLLPGDGLKTFYVQYRNSVGQVSGVYATSIQLDTVWPTGSLVINDGNPVTDRAAATLTLNCSDAGGSGCVEMQFSKDNTTWYAWEQYRTLRLVTLLPADGSRYMYVKFRDAAGNVSPIAVATITVAGMIPSGSISIQGGAETTSSAYVAVALTATAKTGTITQMQFSKDNVTWYGWEPYSTARNVTLLPGNGVRSVYVRFRDSSGNVSPVYRDTIIYDTSPPTAAIVINSGASATKSTQVALTLTVSDGPGSGPAYMQFSKDNLAWYGWETFQPVRFASISAGDGLKTFYARFKDKAGNISSVYSGSILLDTVSPGGSILLNNADAATGDTAATLTLACTDSGSGCKWMQFSKDNVTWFEWEPYSTARNVTLTPPDPGTKFVYVRFKDSAGNISPIYGDSIEFQ